MKKTLLTLTFIAASTSTAFADSLIYGGVTSGISTVDGNNSMAYGVNIGTGLLPFIGLEAGYWHHGSFDDSNGEYDASSLYVAAKPSINIGPLELYAKGGLQRWDKSYSDEAKDDDGFNAMYGVGAEYSLFDLPLGELSVGGSYQVFKMKHSDEDVKNFTFSTTFHFI